MAFNIASPQLIIAILTGVAPSLFWLYFWLRRDRKNPEPFIILLLCFLLGACMVFVAGILQKGTKGIIDDQSLQVVVWAGIEEALKFLIFFLVAYKNRYNDEPIDAAMYMITIALGFAALENALYILRPDFVGQPTAAILTGGLRFFGSTLLHVIASGFIGIVIGLSPKVGRMFFAFMGIVGATFFHSTFNVYVLRNTTGDFLQIYGYLWVAAVITFVILEKLNRMSPQKIS